MKIYDINGIPIKACCSFDYRGYNISCNKLHFDSHEISIWQLDVTGPALHWTTDIEGAIEWVDSRNENKI